MIAGVGRSVIRNRMPLNSTIDGPDIPPRDIFSSKL